MNAVLETIRSLMETNELSEYKLSQLSSVSQSTINSFFNKNNIPSIPTLELICQGLDIGLADFFALVEKKQTEQAEGGSMSVLGGNKLLVHESEDLLTHLKSEHLLMKLDQLSNKERLVIIDMINLLAANKFR